MKKIRTVLSLLITLGFISTLVGGVGNVFGNPDDVLVTFEGATDGDNYIASKTNLVVSSGRVTLAEDCSSYDCAELNGSGVCVAKAIGEYDLPACRKCDGISLSSVNYSDNTQDTTGPNTCSAACVKCSGGSCVSQSLGEDLFNSCSSVTCTNYIYGWGGNSCLKYSGSTANNGDCSGSGTCCGVLDSCGGAGAVSASCGSAGCKKACVAGAPVSSYDIVAEVCYTSGQQGCASGYVCNSTGTCEVCQCSDGTACGSTNTVGGDVLYCDSGRKMWTITASQSYNWDSSITYCNNLVYAGYSDWFLPDKDVLLSLGISACGGFPCAPAWDSNASLDQYWSSSVLGSRGIYVWFRYGWTNIAYKSTLYHVRCVRP